MKINGIRRVTFVEVSTDKGIFRLYPDGKLIMKYVPEENDWDFLSNAERDKMSVEEMSQLDAIVNLEFSDYHK
jgi:hypothetical protein